jgi:hypothetical protein
VSALAATIDQKATYTMSGYFGGFASQGDFADLAIRFLSATGNQLGTAHIGDVTPQDRHEVTGLLLRSASGLVPVGTRSIDVVLTMTRASGSYNDGYADNVSLMLQRA